MQSSKSFVSNNTSSSKKTESKRRNSNDKPTLDSVRDKYRNLVYDGIIEQLNSSMHDQQSSLAHDRTDFDANVTIRNKSNNTKASSNDQTNKSNHHHSYDNYDDDFVGNDLLLNGAYIYATPAKKSKVEECPNAPRKHSGDFSDQYEYDLFEDLSTKQTQNYCFDPKQSDEFIPQNEKLAYIKGIATVQRQLLIEKWIEMSSQFSLNVEQQNVNVDHMKSLKSMINTMDLIIDSIN
jgi:hypothetical protein